MQSNDSSPFNSKYTVLKFNGGSGSGAGGSSKSPNTTRTSHNKYSGTYSSETTPVKRGLFSNASNNTPGQDCT